MKITIIGGSGFVGTSLIELLRRSTQYELLNIDKAKSEKYPEITKIGNVMDKEDLINQLKNTDIIILLAAEHRDDVTPTSLYYDVNVDGIKNVLEAMEVNKVRRIIFTSSVAVYGLDKDNPDESFPAEPFNHYGKSKWEAEQVLQYWCKDHRDWNVNIVRPTVIFGEGNRGNVFNLLNQIANGKFMMIGKGNNQKSMSYIGNVIAFIQFLIEEKREGYNIFNYVDKPDFTTNDLVHHTGKILNKNIPTTHIPYWLGMLGGYGFDMLALLTRKKLNISSVRVKKFCAVTQYDSSKAMKSGFIPPYSMEEGLRRMLEQEFVEKKNNG
ncbi:NAD-dependent epimerase/dehydratase family protein [Elizabethkingia ursingii]|uniref:NAD-dependent epimerase/dehydratase family protein n=1 Tax=Elizabethkingia ursingii TaxID=1756150 RepID=UPI00201176F7|nr:NAD-dependent epimerase/dehydratase family protein [Elizabethkingia ursingii]MCL1671884.1 NAD-dependent epimerase/dehydratase family protein [Elizabethkingia ursingii]